MNQELIKEITLKALSENYEFVSKKDGLSKFIVKKEKFEHILPSQFTPA